MQISYISGFLIITILSLVVNGQSSPPIFNSYRSIQQRQTECTGLENGWHCRNCTNLQFCFGGTSEFSISCSSQFPNRPFCNKENRTCTTEPEDCEDALIGFQCPGTGLYPHLQDCKKYISCSKLGGQAALYNCMFNSVYNHAEKRCRTNSPCYTVTRDCGQQYKIVLYRPDNSLYVICQGTNPPILKDCGVNMVFNSTSLDCGFQCKAEGIFAFPGNANKFIICNFNGRILVKEELDCPANTEFDVEFSTCVEK